ncbi:hypothetical protein A4S06_00345 [Erysipelotrichaceae bacterium MTC7]|nr:hypothetical protein A4S06_00345 [Erysipelotrichaceae bacterium MTC7]
MKTSMLEHLDFSYTNNQLIELESIEKQLQFSRFNSKDAYMLGDIIIDLLDGYEEDIVILITREKDQLPIFQYVMDTKTKKNITYANLKRNCVLETGHSSFWKLVNGIVNGSSMEQLFGNKECMPVGGAFPIYVEGNLEATVAISGLHDGLDHELIVNSLSTYLDKKVIEFTGRLF